MNYSDGYRNMFCAYFNVKLPLISKEIVISKYGKNVNVVRMVSVDKKPPGTALGILLES